MEYRDEGAHKLARRPKRAQAGPSLPVPPLLCWCCDAVVTNPGVTKLCADCLLYPSKSGGACRYAHKLDLLRPPP
jgi:hypothetical protein